MQKKGIELEGLVKSGDVVLAGVSGGADSVCLLLMLLEYRKHCDFRLEAVHVEHGIRGDASRRDQFFGSIYHNRAYEKGNRAAEFNHVQRQQQCRCFELCNRQSVWGCGWEYYDQ